MVVAQKLKESEITEQDSLRLMESSEVVYQHVKLDFYDKNYQIRAPFKVLCDQEFLDLMRKNKTVTVNMNKVLGENRMLYTPRCVITRVATSTSSIKDTLGVEELVCFHKSWEWKDFDPKYCIREILGPHNSGSYMLATVDVERGESMQEEIPSIPIMIGNADGSVRILEPSVSQMKYASEMNEATVDFLNERKKKWKTRMAKNKRIQAKNDVKKAKSDDKQRQLKLRKAAKDKNEAERKARLRASRSSAGSSSG